MFSLEETVKANAMPTIRCYFTPLSLAIYSKSEEITSRLLEFRSLVWDKKQHFLYSPFYEAIVQAYYAQDLRFIDLLIKKLRQANEEKRFLDYFSRKGIDILKSEDCRLAQWAGRYFIAEGLQVNHPVSNQPMIQYPKTFTQYPNPNGFWKALSQNNCEREAPVISTQPRSFSSSGF